MIGDFEVLARQRIEESIAVKQALLQEPGLVQLVVEIGHRLAQALSDGHRFFLFGNGGSAADAQHIAAELVGRYKLERPGLPAFALTVNTSSLTAIANDCSYEVIFSRQLEAMALPADVALDQCETFLIEGVEWVPRHLATLNLRLDDVSVRACFVGNVTYSHDDLASYQGVNAGAAGSGRSARR